MMLPQLSVSLVSPPIPSQKSHFLVADDKVPMSTVQKNEVLVSDSFGGNEHGLNLTVPEPTLRQHKKGRILDQVEILEQATVELIDRCLGRELRERARQEAHELIGSLDLLGLTFEARLAQGIDFIFKRKFPFEEGLILQLAEFVVELRESVEHKTALL